MNQQIISSHQTSSSSSVIPGGSFQSTSTVYQTKEYQYEQQHGGYQTQVKSIPAHQGYALPQQQQYSLQSGFNEFQIPIQKEHHQTQQQQTFHTAQNQFQGSQHEQFNLQNQGQFPTGSNIQYQSNLPQGQFQGQYIPQSHIQSQNPQVKPPGTQGASNFQGNQPQWQIKSEIGSKQGHIPGSQQQGPPKSYQPSLQQGFTIPLQSEETAEWPPKNEVGPNLTTVYPSGFKLKEEAPMDHSTGAQIVPSQPAFKITQPMKMRGDDKWPPRKGTEDVTQEEVREFIKPKKSNRDYTDFFAQNALPNSYPGYRAPPGTQHHATEEEE